MGLSHSPRVVTDSLLLHLDAANPKSYPGSGTTWYDLSSSKNHLTIYNSPTCADGYFTFNGTSHYAKTTTLPTTSVTNFSVCLWLNPSNINQFGMFFHNGRDDGTNAPYSGYGLGMDNGTASGSPGAILSGLKSYVAWLPTGYTFPSANAWYNVIMTADASNLDFYVNGVKTSTGTDTALTSTPTQNFVVGGGYGTSAARYFAGKIAQVSFYNKRLSNTEITQNYNALRGRFGI